MLNPYYSYCSQENFPDYYYNSPFDEEQYSLYPKMAETKQIGTQTQLNSHKENQLYVIDFDSEQQQQKTEELQDLIGADFSIIEPIDTEQKIKPYGIVCMPSTSVYINSCQIQFSCAKLGRISSKVLYVPSLKNQLSFFVKTLFKKQTLEAIKKKLQTVQKDKVEIVYMSSTSQFKFDIFAFHRLSSAREDYLRGIHNVLISSKHIDQKKPHELMIPYERIFDCAKEVVQLILGFAQTQKKVIFKKIVVNCQHYPDYEMISNELNSVVSKFNKKGELTI